jgi:6,7-dimethyl-8-ribityllumazine synthase
MHAGGGQSLVHGDFKRPVIQAVLTSAAIEQSLAKVTHPARMGAEATQLAAVSPISLAIAHGDDPDGAARLLSCEWR